MAYTQFINQLEDAIISNNRDLMKELLSKSTRADWVAADSNASSILDAIAYSRFSTDDQASFATTVVRDAIIDSHRLSDVINTFVINKNYDAARGILEAADAIELKSTPTAYAHLLDTITGSNFSREQQAELAELVVSKTKVDSFGVLDAARAFVNERNFDGAKVVLNEANGAELKATPVDYAHLLDDVTRSNFSREQQTELAKLVISKTKVDSFGVLDAARAFVNERNFDGVKVVLTEASAAELKATPWNYAHLLDDVTRSNFSPEQQAELAQLIVTKTTVDGNGLGNALISFVSNGNLTGAENILTGMSAHEKASVSPMDYGKALSALVPSNTNISGDDKTQLIKLIVATGNVDYIYLSSALSGFTNQGNVDSAKALLNAMSAKEAHTIPNYIYDGVVESLSLNNIHMDNKDTAALIKLILEKGIVDAPVLGHAVSNFLYDGNIEGAKIVLSAITAKDAGLMGPLAFGQMLRAVAGSTALTHTDASDAQLAKLIVEKGAVDGQSLSYALKAFLDDHNVAATKAVLTAMSKDEASTLTSATHFEMFNKLLYGDFTHKQVADIAKLMFEKLDINEMDTNFALRQFADHHEKAAVDAIYTTLSGKEKLGLDTATIDSMQKAGYHSTDEILIGTAGRDVIHGFGGHDVIMGNDGNDVLYGDNGDDWLNGGNGNNTLYGGRGDDFLLGGNNDDKLFGGAGNDILYGGLGNDKLYGGSGDDTLYLDRAVGTNITDGGNGHDTLYLDFNFNSVVIDFNTTDSAIEFFVRGDTGPMASGIGKFEVGVTGIETLHFNDRTIDVADLHDALTTPAPQSPAPFTGPIVQPTYVTVDDHALAVAQTTT